MVQYYLLKQPWPLFFIVTVAVIVLIKIWIDTKDLNNLMRAQSNAGGNVEQLIPLYKRYISYHPLSRYNDLLRVGLLTMTIHGLSSKELKKSLNDIWFYFVPPKMDALLVLICFILRNNNRENDYLLLRRKLEASKKKWKTIEHKISVLDAGIDSPVAEQVKDSNVLTAILYYNSAVAMQQNEPSLAKEYFDKCEQLGNPAINGFVAKWRIEND